MSPARSWMGSKKIGVSEPWMIHSSPSVRSGFRMPKGAMVAAAWLGSRRETLAAKLLAHGAILLRGFSVDEPIDFERVARAIAPDLKKDYLGTSPRDAITTVALEYRDVLRKVGPSEVYARHVAPGARQARYLAYAMPIRPAPTRPRLSFALPAKIEGRVLAVAPLALA